MMYRIEYAGGMCHNTAYSRKDLMEWLEILKDEVITDIRKISKNDSSESVLNRYVRRKSDV